MVVSIFKEFVQEEKPMKENQKKYKQGESKEEYKESQGNRITNSDLSTVSINCKIN